MAKEQLSLNFNDDEYIENVDVSVEAGVITEQNFELVPEETDNQGGDDE
ncbi:MAG: hypothetical protein K0B11_11650 [Mariniphaga sp.]|nr:hypothetical protein [Mariniphaga sp.]